MNWDQHVKPLFDAAYAVMRDEPYTDGDAVAARMGADADDVMLYHAAQELNEQGLLNHTGAGGMRLGLISPTPEGRQIAHGWPRPGEPRVDLLVDALRDAAADPQRSEAERGKISKILTAVTDAGKDITTGVIAEYISRQV